MKKWINYKFNQADYNEAGYDDKAMKKFVRQLEKLIKKDIGDTTDVEINLNPYEISGFVGKDGKMAYFSFPSFRKPGEWSTNILVRSAKDNKDYKGGNRRYTTIDNLTKNLQDVLK